MYIDTHCHLSKEDYDDIKLVLKETFENDVSKVIVSGCSKETIIESLELSKEYSDIYLTLGFHPSEVDELEGKDILWLKNLIKDNKNIVGIGEIGLDYHYGKENKEKQLEFFHKQMLLAETLSLPVVIHSRDAVNDTIEVLKNYPGVVGSIHCFSGSLETAKQYISMGYKLGIGGVITFKNSKLSQVIKEIGIENIILETDAPYLTPEPFRGKKNSSKYLKYIAQYIADALDLDVSVVAEKTTNQAKSLFDLD